MFSILKQLVKLSHVNPRVEMAGSERELSADLKFEITMESRILDCFDPALRGLLFFRSADAAEPGLDIDPDHLPDVRFPLLGKLAWGLEMEGAQFVVHGFVEGNNVLLHGVKVNNFSLSCSQGGAVTVGFRVQCHPTDAEMGRLCGLIGENISVSLTTPFAELTDGGGLEVSP
jgi:hypothetical protein